MRWMLTHRFDPRGAELADRHYSRRTVGSPQFVKPCRNVVRLTPAGDALWVSCAPQARFVRHAWPGSWECALFRNESSCLASELILEAIAATCAQWGPPPREGMTTFVSEAKTAGRRSKRHLPGHCFRMAGFVEVGRTKKGGFVVLHLAPEHFPEPALALGAQLSLAVGA